MGIDRGLGLGFSLIRTRVSLGLRVEMMIVALARVTATRIPRFKPFGHIVGHNNSF